MVVWNSFIGPQVTDTTW